MHKAAQTLWLLLRQARFCAWFPLVLSFRSCAYRRCLPLRTLTSLGRGAFFSQDCSSSFTFGFPRSTGRLFGNRLWRGRRFSTYSFVIYIFYLSISFPPLCLIPFWVVFPLSSVFLCAYGFMLCQWSCARLHRSHRCDPGSLPICWTKAK